jgi:hypothetical protein
MYVYEKGIQYLASKSYSERAEQNNVWILVKLHEISCEHISREMFSIIFRLIMNQFAD